ncbi:hypothetical protein HispidOSU_014422D [Sigmodon hispidus]
MVNEYKRIVLLKGFENISDYYFSLFKSLMNSDLKLERNMQEKYTKVQIADMMEDEFPDDAGLGKLIEFCKELSALQILAETLQEEKSREGNTPQETTQQESGSAIPTSTTSNALASDGGETSTAQKRKSMNKEKTAVKKTKVTEGPAHPPCPGEDTARCQSPNLQNASPGSPNLLLNKNENPQIQNQTITRGAVLQNTAMTVMVLKAIDPFVYESSEHGEKRMFHATVATVSHYFHVKVFNINLKEKFTKENIIIISNYFKFKEILEINEASSVIEAGPDQKIKVSNMVIRKANDTPKILEIFKYAPGALVYGLFTLHKKNVKSKNTIYEVKDDTGSIDVIGNGKCYNINCEEGDKLRLYCFQLKTIDKQPKLVCCDHSFIKVGRRKRTELSKQKLVFSLGFQT